MQAVDVQRSCAARRSQRSVPDEHVHRRAADRVSRDVVDAARSGRAAATPRSTDDERETLATLVGERLRRRPSREAERAGAQELLPAKCAKAPTQLQVTVLTTLQCNFACDYCIQGDHGDYNKPAAKMSLETAARRRRRGSSAARRDRARSSFVLTFFGGEPLLNLPVLYYLAERLHAACAGARRAACRSTSSPTACC